MHSLEDHSVKIYRGKFSYSLLYWKKKAVWNLPLLNDSWAGYRILQRQWFLLTHWGYHFIIFSSLPCCREICCQSNVFFFCRWAAFPFWLLLCPFCFLCSSTGLLSQKLVCFFNLRIHVYLPFLNIFNFYLFTYCISLIFSLFKISKTLKMHMLNSLYYLYVS